MWFLCSLVKHLFCFSRILNKTHLSKARILYQTSLAKLVKSYHNMGTKNWSQRLLIELMSKIKVQISYAGLQKLVHPACIFPWFPSHHAWDTHEKSLMQLLNKCWSCHLWESTALIVELNVFFCSFVEIIEDVPSAEGTEGQGLAVPPAALSPHNPEREAYKKLGLTKHVLAAHTQKEEQAFLSRFRELRGVHAFKADCSLYLERQKGQVTSEGKEGFNSLNLRLNVLVYTEIFHLLLVELSV